jgi:phosphotransacetylase
VSAFLESVRARATARRPRIIFPESGDPRIQAAAEAVATLGIAQPILASASPTALVESADLVAAGGADGMVAGAVHTTADVLRAAIKRIGVAPGSSTISSAFYMVASRPWEAAATVLTFTDCAVVPSPTAVQLADIALAAAADRRRIVGDEPVVAFLSFSTRGSGAGPSVALVREAMAIVRGREPDLAVD